MTASAVTAMDYIVTFTSSHFALKAESALKKAEMAPRLISAPRAISSQCGFCLVLENCDCQDLAAKLKQLTVAFTHIYTRQLIDGVKHYAQQN
ncbi:DUF3343 domain-containing protein [uncultured Photobacterium sp.]|uniref:DUF3343 domain-containing protein n=1 Tax=uncultured Photobacterium sp. TaxID=173973 RepID=UPI002611B96F|nr:DUF3343 domain-containing protein [uncultured Photobacterium sp.]